MYETRGLNADQWLIMSDWLRVKVRVRVGTFVLCTVPLNYSVELSGKLPTKIVDAGNATTNRMGYCSLAVDI